MKATYNRTVEPSYISSLASPMRMKHNDDLLVTKTTVRVLLCRFWDPTFLLSSLCQENVYSAWEEDIAVVNIFFGEETAMGEKHFAVNILITFP